MNSESYWRAHLRLLAVTLVIWFAASFGCGILFVDELNALSIGGVPLGFWFAQQGSIYVFLCLIVGYSWFNSRLERKLDPDDQDREQKPVQKPVMGADGTLDPRRSK